MVAYASDEEPDADKGLSWVSREVLAGAGFGEESDVYSFGIVLWEIMQGDGSLPYAGLSTEQVGLVCRRDRVGESSCWSHRKS